MRKNVQIVLLLALLVATLRAGYILYQRHIDNLASSKPSAPPLNPDYYVTPKKLYPYDLKSARQLTQQPVWVKVGYSYTYYVYHRASRRVDFAHAAGLLLPLEKLTVRDVTLAASPRAPNEPQVMAVFEKDGKSFAFPIGSVKNGNFKVYSDDMLYIQDPHQLYKHWPPDIWQAIDQHQLKPGMNELQADFAIGLGVPERGMSSEDRTVDYPDGGKPLRITYRNGRAAQIQPGS